MRDPHKHSWKIVQFVARQLPPCQAVTRLISEARDRRLSVGEWLTIRLHLMVCAFCTRFGHQIACVEIALKAADDQPGKLAGEQEGLSEAARARIRNRLKSSL